MRVFINAGEFNTIHVINLWMCKRIWKVIKPLFNIFGR